VRCGVWWANKNKLPLMEGEHTQSLGGSNRSVSKVNQFADCVMYDARNLLQIKLNCALDVNPLDSAGLCSRISTRSLEVHRLEFMSPPALT